MIQSSWFIESPKNVVFVCFSKSFQWTWWYTYICLTIKWLSKFLLFTFFFVYFLLWITKNLKRTKKHYTPHNSSIIWYVFVCCLNTGLRSALIGGIVDFASIFIYRNCACAICICEIIIDCGIVNSISN